MGETGETAGEWAEGADDEGRRAERLVIDCDECTMQHTTACDDCIVTFLCGPALRPMPQPVGAVEVRADELAALRRMHEAGLVPRLRHRRALA
jgi:hypothetical protein